MSPFVYVEADTSVSPPRVIRIFRNEKAAFASHVVLISMPREDAVSSVRHQLFLRSKGFCEWCGDILTESSGHMHEKKHRGKGGEISLENSFFICVKTHKKEHSDREPKFTRRSL